ncbi:DUF4388 domain-containing protein [bacterium]|nr:DUF4388 domain-containing protein [candidate division CSSED10-310 bacterium]
MIKRSILVLERNEKIRATLRVAIKKAGFAYFELESNDQLFRFLNTTPVDIILINASQQGLGARSICSIVRNDPQYKRFPLIILYGKQGKVSRMDYMNQGADDFVIMPFSPVQLMGIIKARLRPLGETVVQSLSVMDRALKKSKSRFFVPPLDSKGNLEVTPPASVFSRLFIHNESGILDLIIDKETRTLYFKGGDLIYAETMSRKDDIADYLARYRAGSGSGKEIVAARAQAGGPKSDPNTYAMILKESRLMDPTDFGWWLRIYQVDMMADLFIKPMGVYQWQSLDIPEYATQTTLDPFPTPRIVFEGIRRVKKWWAHRELLPDQKSIPHLSPDFYEKAKDYGMTAREVAMMQIVNGKRTLRTIGEICHLVSPQIENYIYACQQLQILAFDLDSEEALEETIDISQNLEIPDEGEIEDGILIDTEISHKPSPRAISAAEQVARAERAVSEAADSTQSEILRKKPPVLEPVSVNFSLSEGGLEETIILETFRQCIVYSFTGEISYENQKIKKKVFWKKGRIVSASSNDIDERLDNFLFRKHLITPEQRDQLRSAPADLIGSPNEIIKRKILTIDKVFTVVKEQIESILSELLTWRTGHYQCFPDNTPHRDTVPLDLSAQNVIMNSMHDEKILNVWSDQRPGDMEYYRQLAPADSLRGVKLSALERRIINVIHEPVRVDVILRQIDHPERDILLSLISMEMSGIIERCSVL